MDKDLSQLLDDAYSNVGTALGRVDYVSQERQAALIEKAQELNRLAQELADALEYRR